MKPQYIIIGLTVLSLLWTIPVRGQNSATIRVPTDYPSIQQAVNYASPGDIISVAAGTYAENLVINKPVHLIGSSRETTIIEGAGGEGFGPIILVTANNVEIKSFTIQNAETFGQGILVKGVRGVNITANTIAATPEGDGITLDNANNTQITENIFASNLYAVNVTDSHSNLIARNTAKTGTVGVQLQDAENNVVANNTFSAGESGLDLILARDNLVVGNLLKGNSDTGIHIEQSISNQILENNIQLNRFGINIQRSTDNTFYHNNIVFSTFRQVNHVDTASAQNHWDNGTAGNYWSDYDGSDDGSGQRTAGDGIGDTNIPYLGIDYYPLTNPFVPIPLLARIIPDKTRGVTPLTVAFNAEAIGGTKTYTYSWNFGDDTTSSLEDPTHTFERHGTYTVQLRVLDATSSSDQTSVVITVENPPSPPVSPLTLAAVGVGVAIPFGLVFWFLRRRRRTAD